MRYAFNWKVPVMLAVLLTLSLNAHSTIKTQKMRDQSSSKINILPVKPLRSKIDIPAGPRSGQFYLHAKSFGTANGVHSLGVLKANQTLTMYVEGLTTGFDPIVIITAPHWAQNDLTVWEADDTDNDPDPAFEIRVPVSGDYTMMVSEYNGKAGWYRFRMEVE